MPPTTPYTGIGTSLGLGIETTWGTAVSRTNWLYVNSVDPKSKRVKSTVNHLGVSGNNGAHYHWRTERIEHEVKVEMPFAYDDSSLLLLTYAIGDVATTGSTPWVHTFTLDNDEENQSQKGLTLEVIEGSSGRSAVYEGGMPTGFELSLSRGGQLTLSTTAICQTVTNGAAGSPSYHSGTPTWVEYDHAGTVAWNSLTFDKIESFKVTVDRKIERRNLLGSALTQRPRRTGTAEVKISMTVEWDDADAVQDDQLGTDQSDWVLTLAPSSGNEQMVITGHNAICTDVQRGISDRGVLTRTYEFMCFADATDSGLTVAITNDNSASTAN